MSGLSSGLSFVPGLNGASDIVGKVLEGVAKGAITGMAGMVLNAAQGKVGVGDFLGSVAGGALGGALGGAMGGAVKGLGDFGSAFVGSMATTGMNMAVGAGTKALDGCINAEQGKSCAEGAREAEKDYAEGMFAQATFGTLSAIGAGAAAQIKADQIAAAKEAAAKEAARKEAELKELKKSLLAKEQDAKGTQASVIKLTEEDMIMLKEEQLRQEQEKADEAYHKYTLQVKRLDQEIEPMTKDAFMKQNYPALYQHSQQTGFGNAIKTVSVFEGGTVNDKDDKGGFTVKGVSTPFFRDHAHLIGLDTTGKSNAEVMDMMKNLPQDKVNDLFKQSFWDKNHLGDVKDPRLQSVLFDSAINQGNAGAGKSLQQTLNNFGSELKVDGAIGPNTINALNDAIDKYGAQAVFMQFQQERRNRYVETANTGNNDKFLQGWMNRVFTSTELNYPKTGTDLNYHDISPTDVWGVTPSSHPAPVNSGTPASPPAPTAQPAQEEKKQQVAKESHLG